MKKFLAIALMIVATQAHAWGDREQGIVAGVFGTLLLQHIANNGQSQPQVYGQPPVSVGEAPVVQHYPQVQQPQIIVQPQVNVYPQRSAQVYSQPRMYIPAPQNRCSVVPMYDHWGRYVGQQTVCNW
jgi:hypothetical protein